MDSNSLSYSLELVAGSGYTLNVEQRTALQTSLVLLKKNYKFHRVLFWGKIFGVKEDYFIAQGRGEDEMQDKKNLYRYDNRICNFIVITLCEPTVRNNVTCLRVVCCASSSFNCMDWFLLPPATDSMVEEVSTAAKGHFIGDPSYVYERVEIRRQGEKDEERVVVSVVTSVRL